VDEIGFQPMQSWDSLRMGSGKRQRSLAAGLGTLGLDHENALSHLRRLVHEGAVLPGFVFREFAAPEGCAIDDRAAWRIGNPAIEAGFLRESALETDLGITPEALFRIFRLGQEVDGTDAWLGINGSALWESLTRPYEFLTTVPLYIGVDIGLKHDSSAVVVMQVRDDGRIHATCRIWLPATDQPVDITDVMKYLRDLDDRYTIRAVSYDARLCDVPAKMLADGGLPMVEVPQSLERMTTAIGSLYEAVLGKRITHDGDETFARQVLNAVPRFSERGFTLQKGKSRGKIDAAIALALAYDQVLRHEADEPSAYEERGLVTL
jgi:phage terminase large subunit-like protein